MAFARDPCSETLTSTIRANSASIIELPEGDCRQQDERESLIVSRHVLTFRSSVTGSQVLVTLAAHTDQTELATWNKEHKLLNFGFSSFWLRTSTRNLVSHDQIYISPANDFRRDLLYKRASEEADEKGE